MLSLKKGEMQVPRQNIYHMVEISEYLFLHCVYACFNTHKEKYTETRYTRGRTERAYAAHGGKCGSLHHPGFSSVILSPIRNTVKLVEIR